MTDGQPKPIVVMISNSGSNKNPCYRKTVQSASNPVERRMTPLSHDLAEKRNFKAARDVLTTVWEDTIINDYLVLVKYVEPSEESYCPNKKSAAWMEKHVMTCHYMTQVIKCDDPSCCKPFHSGIKQFLPNHFFPPLLIQQKLHSICTASMGISDNTTHFGGFLLSILIEEKLTPPDANLQYFPFNWYCPTINKSINEYLQPVLDIQDYESSETMQVDEAVPEDLLEIYSQQMQVQEKLIADRVLIVD
ncbi:7052_t:CDS:2 [Dentiscutata erythropus]|uniref:7052_t:CDS:1 n=1 Tax=Dentiscutata erythropus TaxID=1348616 RepID=A0A9N9FUV5_9GLOM|nr:7052_t:CDS:2 [Dentiscutata erythropus]